MLQNLTPWQVTIGQMELKNPSCPPARTRGRITFLYTVGDSLPGFDFTNSSTSWPAYPPAGKLA